MNKDKIYLFIKLGSIFFLINFFLFMLINFQMISHWYLIQFHVSNMLDQFAGNIFILYAIWKLLLKEITDDILKILFKHLNKLEKRPYDPTAFKYQVIGISALLVFLSIFTWVIFK